MRLPWVEYCGAEAERTMMPVEGLRPAVRAKDTRGRPCCRLMRVSESHNTNAQISLPVNIFIS